MPPKRGPADINDPSVRPQSKVRKLAAPNPGDVIKDPPLPPMPKPKSVRPRKIRDTLTIEDLVHISAYDRRKYRYQEYLKRAAVTDDPTTTPGGVWKAIKVLGQGVYGIAILFAYKGPDESMPRFIVCKQAGPNDISSLINESQMLVALGKTGSTHVVKMLKSIFFTAGTGVHPEWDPSAYSLKPDQIHYKYHPKLEVGKIYLEYCEEGDFGSYMNRRSAIYPYPSEESIWRILECSVRWLCVLATGTEVPASDIPEATAAETTIPAESPASLQGSQAGDNHTAKTTEARGISTQPGVSSTAKTGLMRVIDKARDLLSPKSRLASAEPLEALPSASFVNVPLQTIIPWDPIVHFDIKANNLFVGSANPTHQNPLRYVHKIADFGMAHFLPVPKTRRMTQFANFGAFAHAKGLKPPEHIYEHDQEDIIGLPGDIWCLAATVHLSITDERIPPRKFRVKFTDQSGISSSYVTQGAKLLELETDQYSTTLLNLLMRCLAFDMRDRPSLASIKETIDGALTVFDTIGLLDKPGLSYERDDLVYDGDLTDEKPLKSKVGRVHRERSKEDFYEDPGESVNLLGFQAARGTGDNVRKGKEKYSGRVAELEIIDSTPELLAKLYPGGEDSDNDA
ncbi:hypothetical protein VTL71DRAFT_843 [Oculimacula yallundae]|uniref:Protein kinase domain-containing protein n=1 Tax=Oculimacula yallundae TaxID=86028 RepID=A0ABR4D1B1_9HELO